MNQLKVGKSLKHGTNGDEGLGAGERCANTKMDSLAERDVTIFFAPDIECVRIGKNFWVAIGGIQHLENHLTIFNCISSNFGVPFYETCLPGNGAFEPK